MTPAMLRGVVILGLLAVPVATARADSIIFTNFGPGFSYNTSLGNIVGNDFVGDNLALGGTFTPTVAAKFSSLDIALSNFSVTNTDTLAVSLDANKGGVPGATLESFTVLPGVLGTFGNNNAPLVLNSFLMPPLTAGTEYWVTVSDVTAGATDTNVWSLNSTGDMSSTAISADGGTTWFAPSGMTPGAYQVNGVAVPAPIVGAGLPGLIIAGGGLLALWRRRRRAQAAA
jgi:hypothetical protein